MSAETVLWMFSVPRIIRTYRESFPLVSLTLEESGTTELIDHLRNERIDAAFIRTANPNQEGLAVSLLLQEAMVLALPHAHILARRGSANKALPLKALAAETFIPATRPDLARASVRRLRGSSRR